jgi:hypothetical protein
MAAAAINHLRDLPHQLRKASTTNDTAGTTSPTGGNRKPSVQRRESRQESKQHDLERKQILHWEADKHPLKPEEIAKRGEEKHVGFSSHRMTVDDFDLLKTLGTGECGDVGDGCGFRENDGADS